ncbi:hypothetical protein M405DRAFT_103278 [Rhizopogon salebrosus TDB-379]|nr:hypothetical protein M405DRAFT_103278 [Rhizopogon salebrosus TDB-379]
MKSDHIQPTTNEAPHPTSAIRSMRRNAHIFVANSPGLVNEVVTGRARGYPIVYLNGKVVDPLRGCEPVGYCIHIDSCASPSHGRVRAKIITTASLLSSRTNQKSSHLRLSRTSKTAGRNGGPKGMERHPLSGHS